MSTLAEPSPGTASATSGPRGAQRSAPRPARALHPGAWWIWALGMATAASRTTDPLLLGVIIAVVAVVVSARRTEAPWARGFVYYLYLAGFVITLRVVFRMALGGEFGTTILFTLPEIALPESAAGVRIGGPVSLEGVLAALYDGLRLATLLICLGAANVLANPKRLLRSLPAALFEIGVAVTVALSVAPQLVESALRVHRSRKLRGGTARRTRLLHEVAVPVMTDALDRSLVLAAAMDSRGYGRHGEVPRSARRLTTILVLAGLCGVCVGAYGLLDSTTPALLGVPALLAGVAAASVGFALGGRRVRRSRYRPDPWRAPEWAVAGCGAAVAVGMVVAGSVDPDSLHPSLQPLAWPSMPPAAIAAALIGLLPAAITPTIVRSAAPAPSVGAAP